MDVVVDFVVADDGRAAGLDAETLVTVVGVVLVDDTGAEAVVRDIGRFEVVESVREVAVVERVVVVNGFRAVVVVVEVLVLAKVGLVGDVGWDFAVDGLDVKVRVVEVDVTLVAGDFVAPI